MKSSLEAPEKQIAEETTAKPATAPVIDTSKMSAGKAAALELAESSRDPLDERGSFASNLFIGRFDFDRIFPFPIQGAEDKPHAQLAKSGGSQQAANVKTGTEVPVQAVLSRQNHHYVFVEKNPGEPESMEEIEQRHILSVLEKNKGNRAATAAELDISVRKLYYRLREYQKKGLLPEK